MNCCFCGNGREHFALAIPNKTKTAYLCNVCIIDALNAVFKSASLEAFENHAFRQIARDMKPCPRGFQDILDGNLEHLLS